MNQMTSELPMLAPCRRVAASEPLKWIARGLQDYRLSLRVSLGYGLLFFVVSLGTTLLAWWLGGYVLAFGALTGFVFVGPVLATGLYSISRQIQRGETVSFARSIQRMRRALGNAMVFALILMVLFLIWARAASMVHIFFPVEGQGGLLALIPFLAIGSGVGLIFAALTLAFAAFSLPMIVDREVDMVTAVITSVNAVLRNKPAMLVWSAMIAGWVLLSFLTLGLGLILSIPLLGYATYHGYLKVIVPDDWPSTA